MPEYLSIRRNNAKSWAVIHNPTGEFITTFEKRYQANHFKDFMAPKFPWEQWTVADVRPDWGGEAYRLYRAYMSDRFLLSKADFAERYKAEPLSTAETTLPLPNPAMKGFNASTEARRAADDDSPL
jgi:hypothetical protein